MDYNAYFSAIADLLAYPTQSLAGVTSATDTDFNAIFPRLIEYAEQRLYRDLDVQSTRKVSATTTFTSGNRQVTAPADLLICNGMNCITPYSASSADAGVRNPLRPISLDFLECIYPRASVPQDVPRFYANLDNSTFIVGPTPDQNYRVEWRYVFRPTALSSANTTTYLSLVYPDLMVAAGMVFGAGFMKNFGAQADDPKMSQSWETQYQTLLPMAKAEVMRTKTEAEHDLSPSAPPASVPQA